MTQIEAEMEYIKCLISYSHAVKNILELGVPLQNGLIDFYTRSNNAVFLSDRRCKKILEENQKILTALKEYIEETEDNIKVMAHDCDEIIKSIDKKDATD